LTAPSPPQNLSARSPVVFDLAPDDQLFRFYRQRFAPVYFDRSKSGRLNAPNGEFGVLYAAVTRAGAFAETFLRRAGATLIAADFIAARGLATLRILQPLKLAQMFGNGLAKIGATAEVTHSSAPYDVPQDWALQLHAHPGSFDGIAYRARHNDSEICVALFDRAEAKFVEVERQTDLDHDWFYDLADVHGVGVA